MNLNPNLLALIVAALWGLAPIFEKMSLHTMNPTFILSIRFFMIAALLVPFFITTNHRWESTTSDKLFGVNSNTFRV